MGVLRLVVGGGGGGVRVVGVGMGCIGGGGRRGRIWGATCPF